MLPAQQGVDEFLATTRAELRRHMRQAPVPKWDVDGFNVFFTRPLTDLHPLELSAYKLAVLLYLRGRISSLELTDIQETFAVSPKSNVSFSWMGAPDPIAARSYVQGVVEQSVQQHTIVALIHSIVQRAQETLSVLGSYTDIEYVQDQLSNFS